MKRVKIKNEQIAELSGAPKYEFPKYTTQVINLANQDAGGTRPAVVGQMSELIQEFDGQTVQEWIDWYSEKYPDAIERATDKIYGMLLNIREAAALIDKQMVEDWVKDLVYTKTYVGLKVQSAIVSYIGQYLGLPYKLAGITQEALGIDGFIGGKPISIKPITYKIEGNRLMEKIDAPIVYYEKKQDGINVEFDPTDFLPDKEHTLF